MLINSKKKKIADKTYFLNHYNSAMEFCCTNCNKHKKEKHTVTNNEDEKLICMSCYRIILANYKAKRQKEKAERISELCDCSKSDVYKRVPLLHSNIAQTGKCILCNGLLNNDYVEALMTDGKNIVVRHVPVKYCSQCEVGFATAKTMERTRDMNSGYYLDIFMIGRGSAKEYTLPMLWGKINSGDITKVKVPKVNTGVKRKNIDDDMKIPYNSRLYVGVKGGHDCIVRPAGQLVEFKGILVDSKDKIVTIILKKCPKCGKIFIGGDKYQTWKNHLDKYIFVEKEQKDNNVAENTHNKIYNINPKDFLTRTNVYYCSKREHKLDDIRCTVKVLTSIGIVNDVKIAAAYCRKCNKYYILESEYRKLKTFGSIVCKVVEQSFWNNSKNKNEYKLNEESLLHIMGYNVNSQENIPKSQRWKLLEIIVDENILTRMEICSHLDYLISRSKNRSGFDSARSKWMEDRNHIINYSKETMNSYTANTIIHRNYKK